jgi:enoyl-CoA hydratase/carnithine racemase
MYEIAHVHGGVRGLAPAHVVGPKSAGAHVTYETIDYRVYDERVATITLNRPAALNSFNQAMCDEFQHVWNQIRLNDDVHAVVLRAAGDRAFSTGVDVRQGLDNPTNVWSHLDPGSQLGPKANAVWKPVVAAVHGMAAGGAFYWINEADIVICSSDATFFDPHVTYGMTAALEPIGLAHRIPLGDVLRMALLGLDERLSAERALTIGLVTEIVPRANLWQRAHELAAGIATKPAPAVQGTVRAIWESLDMTRSQALANGLSYTLIGNALCAGDATIGNAPIGSVDRASVERDGWTLR